MEIPRGQEGLQWPLASPPYLWLPELSERDNLLYQADLESGIAPGRESQGSGRTDQPQALHQWIHPPLEASSRNFIRSELYSQLTEPPPVPFHYKPESARQGFGPREQKRLV